MRESQGLGVVALAKTPAAGRSTTGERLRRLAARGAIEKGPRRAIASPRHVAQRVEGGHGKERDRRLKIRREITARNYNIHNSTISRPVA
jgi:hypothetical protein